MAEEASEQKEGGVMAWASGLLAAVVKNGYLGGELQAAGKQGLDELGAAMQAFPDSIQIDRGPVGDSASPPAVMPSPAEIASQGSIHGDQQANTQLPSPSEIAEQQPSPEQSNGQVLEHSHGRSM